MYLIYIINIPKIKADKELSIVIKETFFDQSHKIYYSCSVELFQFSTRNVTAYIYYLYQIYSIIINNHQLAISALCTEIYFSCNFSLAKCHRRSHFSAIARDRILSPFISVSLHIQTACRPISKGEIRATRALYRTLVWSRTR